VLGGVVGARDYRIHRGGLFDLQVRPASPRGGFQSGCGDDRPVLFLHSNWIGLGPLVSLF